MNKYIGIFYFFKSGAESLYKTVGQLVNKSAYRYFVAAAECFFEFSVGLICLVVVSRVAKSLFSQRTSEPVMEFISVDFPAFV